MLGAFFTYAIGIKMDAIGIKNDAIGIQIDANRIENDANRILFDANRIPTKEKRKRNEKENLSPHTPYKRKSKEKEKRKPLALPRARKGPLRSPHCRSLHHNSALKKYFFVEVFARNEILRIFDPKTFTNSIF